MATDVGLSLDQDEIIKRTMAIIPDRDRYFSDMISALRKKYTAIKLVYANNLPGKQLDPMNPTSDFVLIFTALMKSNKPNLPDVKLVLIDAPLVFSDRSIAGWTLAVENGKKEAYLEYLVNKSMRITNQKFEEYVEHMCLLSLDPNHHLFWKKPENTDKLMIRLMELCARYSPQSSTRLRDMRGYNKDKPKS